MVFAAAFGGRWRPEPRERVLREPSPRAKGRAVMIERLPRGGSTVSEERLEILRERVRAGERADAIVAGDERAARLSSSDTPRGAEGSHRVRRPPGFGHARLSPQRRRGRVPRRAAPRGFRRFRVRV